MSDLPGEITKQSLVAPARIIRSTRYSLTARGRSVWPSRRLPTGSSSFENASGWMRLPIPAAGMIPSMITSDAFDERDELTRAVLRRVLSENAVARATRDRRQRIATEVERGERVGGLARDQDLVARREELVEPWPVVAEHGGAARRRLEKTPRRAIAETRHGP